MATSVNNILMRGLSGMISRLLVFRTVRNKIIVSSAPSFTAPQSKLQKQQVNRFKQAMMYAKAQMHDPQCKAGYTNVAKERNMPNAFNVAVADFFHAPVIGAVEVSADAGFRVSAQVTDDFWVSSVEVQVYDAAGMLLEKGPAFMQASRSGWLYTSASSFAPGCSCVVKAYDLPGNETISKVFI